MIDTIRESIIIDTKRINELASLYEEPGREYDELNDIYLVLKELDNTMRKATKLITQAKLKIDEVEKDGISEK